MENVNGVWLRGEGDDVGGGWSTILSGASSI